MNIYKKIHIHFFYYGVALISIMTGMFREFIIFSSIIIIHEMGHIITALYFKWKIDKVIILPFGGITVFKEHINRPIKEEFFILIMGPLIQILFYIWCNGMFGNNLILTNYHYAILFFNLLPIYPLDGSKLINILLNKIISFKKSHLTMLYMSVIIFFLLLYFILNYQLNLLYILILFFLLLKVLEEIRRHNYIFNKFLFERLIYEFKFTRNKIIKGDNVNKMYRNHKHLFFFNNKYCSEKEILQKKFDFH